MLKKKADHILEVAGLFVITVSPILCVKLDCKIVWLIVNWLRVFMIRTFDKFLNISVNSEGTRTADHILEISKQGAFNATHILEGNVIFTRF